MHVFEQLDMIYMLFQTVINIPCDPSHALKSFYTNILIFQCFLSKGSTCFRLVVQELQLECPSLDSSFGHCENLHVDCSIRDRKPLHGEPHGDVLAASMLTSISSLDHFGGARIFHQQKKKKKEKKVLHFYGPCLAVPCPGPTGFL